MINNIVSYLTVENIFLISNWGVIPLWLLLILSPNSGFTRFIVHTVMIPFILASAYIFIAYRIFLDGNFLDGFELYSGLDGLYSAFSNETILLIFWLHFLAISLFAGAWIVRDARKYLIPKIITIPSLILTYFSGPVGLLIYWFVRIFFAKKISFND